MVLLDSSGGVPVKLLHRIEPHVLDALPGQADYYVSWEQQRQILARLLAGGLCVGCSIPL